MKVSLTKKYHFSSAHRLNSPFLNDEQNVNIYEKCNNFYGHGHDYYVWITVQGSPHADTGMIVPVKELDKKVVAIMNLLDYKHLDKEVDFFREEISTAENIIRFIWINLKDKITEAELVHIKLWETNNNYFELGREL